MTDKEHYRIDTDDLYVAMRELVSQAKRFNYPGVGGFKAKLWDGSTIKIEFRDAKPCAHGAGVRCSNCRGKRR